MNLEEGIMIGSISFGEGEAKIGTGIRIGGSELTDHGMGGLVFEEGGSIKFERVRDSIGNRVWISWVGTIGKFSHIGKAVAIIISVGVVFGAVAV